MELSNLAPRENRRAQVSHTLLLHAGANPTWCFAPKVLLMAIEVDPVCRQLSCWWCTARCSSTKMSAWPL